MSIHPVMTDEEIHFILDAIEQVSLHFKEWKNDYMYDAGTNEYHHVSYKDATPDVVKSWFDKKLN